MHVVTAAVTPVPIYQMAVPGAYPPRHDVDAEPMIDERIGRGMDGSWTLMDGAAGDGGLPRQYHRRLRN
jgi:hypothetical protein